LTTSSSTRAIYTASVRFYETVLSPFGIPKIAEHEQGTWSSAWTDFTTSKHVLNLETLLSKGEIVLDRPLRVGGAAFCCELPAGSGLDGGPGRD